MHERSVLTLMLAAALLVPMASPAAGSELPAPTPPPLLARPLLDEDGPSPFPSREAFEQFIPIGRAPVDLLVGVSQGHEYIMRREGESTLGPQMGLVFQPRGNNLTFFGRIDMHQLNGPDDRFGGPGDLERLGETTTYTIGVGWKF